MQFTPVKIVWSTSTFIFYLAIILLCYFAAALGRKTVLVSGNSVNYRKESWYILISAILIFVKGFGTTGRDLRGGYYLNFLSATSMTGFRDKSIEIGYRILNVIVRKFTDEYWIFILICSLITIMPVMHMLKRYADQIDLPIAVLLYVTCYFFQGLSLIRICMASSISMCAFGEIISKKPGKALLWIILGAAFHTSALVMIIPYFLCLAKMLSKKMVGISLVTVFLFILIGRESISSFLFSTNNRYSIYIAMDTVRIGFAEIVYYVPLFALYILGQKFSKNSNFDRAGFIYLIVSFFLGMLEYVIRVFGRMAALTLPLIIIIPYYSRKFKEGHPHYRIIVNLTMLFYCIARFVIYITGMYNSDDIMPYTNIFGWTI